MPVRGTMEMAGQHRRWRCLAALAVAACGSSEGADDAGIEPADTEPLECGELTGCEANMCDDCESRGGAFRKFEFSSQWTYGCQDPLGPGEPVSVGDGEFCPGTFCDITLLHGDDEPSGADKTVGDALDEALGEHRSNIHWYPRPDVLDLVGPELEGKLQLDVLSPGQMRHHKPMAHYEGSSCDEVIQIDSVVLLRTEDGALDEALQTPVIQYLHGEDPHGANGHPMLLHWIDVAEIEGTLELEPAEGIGPWVQLEPDLARGVIEAALEGPELMLLRVAQFL